MNENDLYAKLENLLRETGPAHHQAYIETDGDDPEWPIWYAGYLQPRISELFRLTCTQSELVYLLVSAELDRRQKNPTAPWPAYYAEFFLARYQAMVDEMPGVPTLHL